MKILSLSIENFRNISTAKFTFNEKVFITGKNGSGKTSILEAINYFSAFKSFRESNDKKIIRNGSKGFLIRMESLVQNESLHAGISVSGNKKEMMFNNEKVMKHSDVFGVFLSVVFSGFDKMLASRTPMYRRKFIDRILSLSDRQYFEDLITYHSILKKRNFMLKHNYNERLSDTYAMQMSKASDILYEKRIEFIYYFNSVLNDTISRIYNENKDVKVSYISSKDGGDYTDRPLYSVLQNSRYKEMQRKNTLFGLHLDDYDITVDGRNITHTGSDGEKRLLGLAFKLAETELIYENSGEFPVILIDDITAEIDNAKKEEIMKIFDTFPQIIITSPIIEDNISGYPVITLD